MSVFVLLRSRATEEALDLVCAECGRQPRAADRKTPGATCGLDLTMREASTLEAEYLHTQALLQRHGRATAIRGIHARSGGVRRASHATLTRRLTRCTAQHSGCARADALMGLLRTRRVAEVSP